MKSTAKRISLTLFYALLLGFAASWLIPNLLLEIPRRVGTSPPIRLQTIVDNEINANRGFVNIFDYRWLGIAEQQFTATRRFSTKNQRKMMELWWAWEMFPEPRQALDRAWARVRSEFDPAEFAVEESQYSIIKVGFPALSFRGVVAINAKAPLANNTLDSQAMGFFVPPINQPTILNKFAGTESMPATTHTYAPHHPIWSGLIFNTMFYALIFWVLLSIERTYRHARRMRQGRCPMCSYELEFVFANGCSECGWRKVGNEQWAGYH